MTNSSVSQWEVAGSKKAAYQKTVEKAGVVTRKGSKIPVVETLKPLRQENGMYDFLAEPEEEEIKKPKKSPRPETKKAPVNAPVSPKQKKEEPVNLLKSNIESRSKRKSTQLSTKDIKADLEKTMSQLSLESFQSKYTHLESLFPENYSLVMMHMAAFLNQSLNDVPDLEPEQNHENESNMYPSSKLDKKIEKFLNGLISKLKRADSEIVFDYCLNEIIRNENPKVLSNHGLRIFSQFIIKFNPNVFMNNLHKLAELLFTNRHRHQRIMLALWSISQIGFFNLTNGVSIWFEVMLPLISVKHYNIYVSTYLSAIFDHHKLDSKSIVSKYRNNYIISLDQYLKMYELANEKSLNILTNKNACQKFKYAFSLIRALFLSNLEFTPEGSFIFETLLVTLNPETSPKQNEYLEVLVQSLFSNTDCLKTWKKLYAKNIQQSSIFIDHLLANYSREFRNMNNMRETLVEFDQQTTSILQNSNLNSPSKDEGKRPYYLSKKSQKTTNNLAEVEKFNKVVKQTLKKNFKRVSLFSVMLRTFITFTLFTALFFYWDQTYNKSFYLRAGQKQLEKYGLLDDTVRIIEATKKTYFDAKKAVNYYVPIWYKKTSDTVLPYTKKAWDTTIEYSKLAWKNTEKLRHDAFVFYKQAAAQANVYYQDASLYIQENFPIVKKSVVDTTNLGIEYALKANDKFQIYASQATHYIGTQLLGWKTGELEMVIFDFYQTCYESFQFGIQWTIKNVKNLLKTTQ